LKIPCIPVALNSGKIWPKNSFMKYPGDIHVSFLKPVMPGLEKNIFLKKVEENIYSEIEKYY
jgi:1-acyl-sn-glycerol-3-phosphate acyltransferase